MTDSSQVRRTNQQKQHFKLLFRFLASTLTIGPIYYLIRVASSTDKDGQITAYSWRSSIDGDLSTSASFITRKLSVGEHTVSFKVQDNEGAWSEEVTRKVTVKRRR